MAKSTVYKGNTIDNFGRNLPVPYVERIEIRDVQEADWRSVGEELGIVLGADVPISKITIVTSLLFNAGPEFMMENFTRQLFNDLNINFLSLTNVDQINSLRESKKNLKSVVTAGLDDTALEHMWSHTSGLYNQFQTLPLGSTAVLTALSFTSEYDENNNEIQKSSNIAYDLYVPSVFDLDNLTIFVGVSVGDPADMTDFQDIVYALSFGDLAIERVKQEGVLNARDSIGFFDVDGAYYPGATLMDLQARYRQAEDFNQEDIKEGIDSLKKVYENDAKKDKELESVFNNVDYIYSKYGTTPMYLVQLNRFRRNIKNQDLASPGGKFYERYRRLILNAASALRSYPEVTKRITYSSKIRDYRPAQWSPEPVPTYVGTDTSALNNSDFAYKIFLQTNLAKYVGAHSEAGLDSPFQPEVPYTPNEMEAAYLASVGRKFERFLGTETDAYVTSPDGTEDRPKGMDNLVDWLAIDREETIDSVVGEFKQSIQDFQDWAVRRDVSAMQRIYYGGPEDSANWLAIARYEQGLEVDIDFEDQRNALAFESAKRFFGRHGNPESNNCTLEFGWDAAKTSDGWNCNLRSMQSSVGWNNSVTVDSGGTNFNGYKCFYQEAGMINVVGHGSTTNTDDDIYGVYLKLQDAEGSSYADSWNLRSANWLAENKLRPVIEEYMTEESVEGIYVSIQGAFDYLRTNWLGGSGATRPGEDGTTGYETGALWTELITNEDSWNQLAADHNLLDEDGVLKEGALATFTSGLVDAMDSWITQYAETVTAGGSLFKNFRLRWCPDVESTTSIFDPGRQYDSDPYGGSWSSLVVHREKRDPRGHIYNDADEAAGRSYFKSGGCGSAGHGGSHPRHSGAGRHEVNLAYQIVEPALNRWQNAWKDAARDAIKDAVRLVAEYHGLSISKGQHMLLSRVDIITQKYGWFFFDLEKYIQKHSALSRFINPGLFQKYFEWGRDMVNNKVRIEDVTFYRCPTAVNPFATGGYINGYGQTGPHVKMKLNYNSSYNAQPTDIQRLKFVGSCGAGGSISAGNAPYAKIKHMDVASWTDLAVTRPDDETYIKDKETGEAVSSYVQYSYLMQRNYDFAYDDKIPNDYRMACFAYNYYIDDDEALMGPDSVGVKVTIRDRSDQIIVKYHEYLVEILEGFEDYVALAEESCAYNSFDGQFNQFFINAMDDQYGDNMTAAPWLRAAASYALYEDIYFAKYGGEYSIVLEAASSQADNINPYTGNVEALREFADELNTMVTNVEVQATIVGMIGTTSEGTEVIPEYTEFIIGNAHTSEALTRGPVLIDKGMIDYAADLDSVFPAPLETDSDGLYATNDPTPSEES